MLTKITSKNQITIPKKIIDMGKRIATISKYQIIVSESPQDAVKEADVVYTDVWTSMGQEVEHKERQKAFAPYQITSELLSQANTNAVLMHPMPVHHGEEFAEGIIDHPQSVLIDQAENRLHAQKAILVELMRSMG